MKRMSCIAKVAVFVWMASASISAWANSGYIFDTAGTVFLSVGKGAPQPAEKAAKVTTGTMVRTGDNSYAVLKFEDGQVVNLESNSTFLVREYIYNPKQVEKNNIVFSMFKGGMRFVTGLIGQHNKEAFRLATPNATIGVRGTDFMVVIKDGQTYMKVLSGSVKLTNAAGTAIVTAGQTVLLTSSAVAPAVIAADAVPAGIFTGASAINLEEALAAQKAAQAAAQVAAQAAEAARVAQTAQATEAAAQAEEAARVAQAAAQRAAGGAATGGAGAATTATAATAGVSATTIAIGVGVAAVVAAVVSSSTSHH